MHLRALVLLRLKATGDVLETRLAKPSGNDLLDSAVMAAVRRASPFSPPPTHLRDSLQKVGVQLEFRP
jgi:TonB family protein